MDKIGIIDKDQVKLAFADRLNMFLKETGKSVADLAREDVIIEAKIAYGNLIKWTKGHKPDDHNQQKVLEHYIDKELASELEKQREREVTLLKLRNSLEINEREPIYESKFRTAVRVQVPLKGNGKPWRVTDPNVVTGSLIKTNSEQEIILDLVEVPFIGEVDGAIEMIGDSMEPTYMNGCRLFVTRVDNLHDLEWGACYLIIGTNNEISIKRVYQSHVSDCVLLKSDNPDQEKYPPYAKPWDKILTIFKIKGYFLKN